MAEEHINSSMLSIHGTMEGSMWTPNKAKETLFVHFFAIGHGDRYRLRLSSRMPRLSPSSRQRVGSGTSTTEMVPLVVKLLMSQM